MKKLITLLALIVMTTINAQAPQGFNYQATVRNSSGALIINQNVNFKFNLMLNSASSVPVFSETHYTPTDDLGQVNLVIGQGTATVGTFSSINWANGSYYLGIELNTGSGYIAMGTTQLLSVPYALYANSSGNSNFNFPNGTSIGDTLNWIWNGTAWVPTSTTSTTQLPVIATVIATNTLTSSPSSGGTITSDGGYSITSKGVCWSTSPNPTISNNITNDGTGASNFTSLLSNLTPTTLYYYRAYATNSNGTSYGNAYTFTTIAVPQITTTTISTITSSTASSGGAISGDGGAYVSVKGVCWSTSPNPTIALTTKTTQGTGNATFTSSITGLLPGTTYYVRAYATNFFGTAYGQQEVFTSLATLPTLTTTVASAITSSTASSGGVISSDGGAPVTNKGIVWSTVTNPTITTNQGLTSDGTGIGSFTSAINQLNSGTTYYVRAYATNNIGTAYANEVNFTTLNVPGPNVIDIDGNNYQSITNCNQTLTNSNLNVSKYNDGTPIPQVTDPTAWANLTTGAWCYNNNNTANGTTYGKLYNWYAVAGIFDAASDANPALRKKLAPTGWHIPSGAEWTTLTNCLGGESGVGGKMKSTGTSLWLSPNLGATNSSGFTGLPGGYRGSNGTFYGISNNGNWWNSSEYTITSADYRVLYSNNIDSYSNPQSKKGGYSVRCIKD